MGDSLEIKAKTVDNILGFNGFLTVRQPTEILSTREGGVRSIAIDSAGCKEVIDVTPNGKIKSSYEVPAGKTAKECTYTKRDLPKGKNQVTKRQVDDVKTYLAGQVPPPKEEPEKKEKEADSPYPPEGSSRYLSFSAPFVLLCESSPYTAISRLWRS